MQKRVWGVLEGRGRGFSLRLPQVVSGQEKERERQTDRAIGGGRAEGAREKYILKYGA